MKKLVVILVSAIVLLSSCTKEEDLSNTELLCNKDWKLSAWTYAFAYNGENVTLDIYNYPEKMGIPDCILDDYLNFDPDGTYSTKPGVNVCDYSWFGSGDWEFNANEAVLAIKDFRDTTNTNINYNILKLNENTCSFSIIESVEINNSGEFVDATVTYTYGH